MNFFWTASRRVVAASFLLLTIIDGHGEAIAGQLGLTWIDRSADEVRFSVERSTGTAGTFAEIATTGPGVTTHTDPTIADSTTYCYRVRAFDAIAYSAYSNVACGASAHSFSLGVVKLGAGTGTVISTLSGIICGATCFGSYASGTAVTLTATPATGSTFTGWSGGGCSGTGPCTVTLTTGTTLTATFDPQPVILKVSRRGNHKGTVSSTPSSVLAR